MKRTTKLLLAVGALAGGSAALLKRHKNQVRESTRITTPNGIDEDEFVYIGGIEQYLYHRGQDRNNPVMLFLHGGPGSPELPLLHTFQFPWEDRVTIVHWDQRNAGKTFLHNRPAEVTPTTTLERMIEDTDEVVSYLKRKYDTDKILLMGHSWGSVLGTSYIKRYPDSILAYIGVGQVANMQDNERVGLEKTLEAAERAGCTEDIERIHALEPYPGDFSGFMKKIFQVRKLQSKYKLSMGIFTLDNIKMVLTTPFYSLADCAYFIRPDMTKAQIHLFEDLFDFDLPSLGTDYKMPFFIIQGERDWQTPYSLARAYYETVNAPIQRFYSIPDAGHFTMVDQKEQFNQAFFEILDQTVPLLQENISF